MNKTQFNAYIKGMPRVPSPKLGITFHWSRIARNDEKQLMIPLVGPNNYEDGLTVDNYTPMTEKRVENAIFFTLLKTKYKGSFKISFGRYNFDYTKFSAGFLRSILDEMLKWEGNRINYSWLEPIQTLLLEKEDKREQGLISKSPRRKTKLRNEEYNQEPDWFDDDVPIDSDDVLLPAGGVGMLKSPKFTFQDTATLGRVTPPRIHIPIEEKTVKRQPFPNSFVPRAIRELEIRNIEVTIGNIQKLYDSHFFGRIT